jgi:hypothetical protein
LMVPVSGTIRITPFWGFIEMKTRLRSLGVSIWKLKYYRDVMHGLNDRVFIIGAVGFTSEIDDNVKQIIGNEEFHVLTPSILGCIHSQEEARGG